MEDWRKILRHCIPDSNGRSRVQCIICDKQLLHNRNTWSSLKRHAESHIARGETINTKNGVPLCLIPNNDPIRERTYEANSWRQNYTKITDKRILESKCKCKICGKLLQDSNGNWGALKRHSESHNREYYVQLRKLPLPYKSSIYWHMTNHKKYLKKPQYRIEFWTDPIIKAWMSPKSYQKIDDSRGFITLPANKRLIKKVKLQRVGMTGPEILVYLKTQPEVRCWIRKADLKKSSLIR